MSYNSKNFSVMAYANGFTLWNYSSSDTLASIKAQNYFNATSPFVKTGDMILVAANNEATVEPAILAVSSIASDVVSVAQIGGTAA